MIYHKIPAQLKIASKMHLVYSNNNSTLRSHLSSDSKLIVGVYLGYDLATVISLF
jgi:hypothetical protein